MKQTLFKLLLWLLPFGLCNGSMEGAELTNSRLESLLERIAAEGSYTVSKNADGDVVQILLIGSFYQKTNLTILEDLGSLETVTFRSRKEFQLSTNEIEGLLALPKLNSVCLQCFGELESNVFIRLCKDQRLKTLKLIGAWPPKGEFNSITNLQSLERTKINCWPSFGREELTILAQLPKLNSLTVFGTAVSATDTNILKNSSSLTNIDFIFRDNSSK